MIIPHGGKLIDRVLKGEERQRALERARSLPKIDLDRELAFEVENIATGVFSPLEGFLGKEDFESVLTRGRLANDLPWAIPIVLDISKDMACSIKDEIALYYNGEPIALLQVREIYTYDKERMAQQVYGTTNEEHPGVLKIKGMKQALLAGPIDLINPVPSPFPKCKLSPKETRVLFELKGWKTVVGFQTRNVPHLGHEYVQKAALTFVDGLFINPLIGWKKPGDFKDEVIIKAYEALLRHYYPKDSVIFAVLAMEMRYAGPREAIHHAIVRKNFGCTHFIVGRDHAGVGNFYGPYEAWEIFKEFPDLGITPFFIRESFYCRKCGGMVNAKICPHGEDSRIRISGTQLREMIKKGEKPVEEVMRPEVAEAVLSFKEPFIK